MNHYESVHKQDVGWKQAAHIYSILKLWLCRFPAILVLVVKNSNTKQLLMHDLCLFLFGISVLLSLFPLHQVKTSGKDSSSLAPRDHPLIHFSDISRIVFHHFHEPRSIL